MADKPFIRVKDRVTKHQYDVHEQAFDPERHEPLKRFPRSKIARPAKPFVNLKPAPVANKTSASVAVEGVSPAGD